MLLQDRTKGILIALFGILCITPDAVLVRFLSDGGVDPWTIVFWKCFFSLPLTTSYAVHDMGGFGAVAKSLEASKRLYLAALLPQAAVNVGFTFSFVHTTAAHALLLINLNPLWCALLGRLALGETLPRHTIGALILAMGCMLLTFVPEIVQSSSSSSSDHQEDLEDDDDDDDEQGSTTKGNVISLSTGLTIAIYITLVRKGGIEGRNMIAVSPMAAAVASALALIMQQGQVGTTGSDFGDSVDEIWKFWTTMVAEGVMVGIVFVCIAIAPRLITAAEMALVLLLEVILGPLWVFLAYRETPSQWTLIGGLSLVAVLALHEIYPLVFLQSKEGEEEEEMDIVDKDADDADDDDVDKETEQEEAKGEAQIVETLPAAKLSGDSDSMTDA